MRPLTSILIFDRAGRPERTKAMWGSRKRLLAIQTYCVVTSVRVSLIGELLNYLPQPVPVLH